MSLLLENSIDVGFLGSALGRSCQWDALGGLNRITSPCTQESKRLDVPYLELLIVPSSGKISSVFTHSRTADRPTFDDRLFILLNEICSRKEYVPTSSRFVTRCAESR